MPTGGICPLSPHIFSFSIIWLDAVAISVAVSDYRACARIRTRKKTHRKWILPLLVGDGFDRAVSPYE